VISLFDIKKEAKALVAKMTPEEKVLQMVHASAQVERLDIPSYNWWNEALHGVARAGVSTMFPQSIALAATFSEDTVHRVADIISTEGRAKYNAFQQEGDHDIFKGLTFWAPNVNIFRDPRWGRGHETYGEDPYLTARLGVAFIRGIQGPDRDALKAAACAKHFAVHSGPESERHEFNAECSVYDLWNTYLPAFEAAVKEAGVEAVMGAYNRTLGEPCCGSKLLLKDILRDKWGFDGHVVSDCWAIKDFHESHKVTKTPAESAALAVNAGCDINCGNMFLHCIKAMRENLLSEDRINEAVRRLVVARMRLGMLGAPQNPAYTQIPYDVLDSKAHRDVNMEAARRSLVLLKNDGALPLNPAAISTIGVIGPNADNRRCLEGNYEGTASEHITVLQGVRRLAQAEGCRVMYAEGCHMFKDSANILGGPDDRLAEARTVIKHSDAVVLCLGLDADIEGEESDAYSLGVGGDKPGIELPGSQQRLLEGVAAAADGKPVILVLISGSGLAVGRADAHVNGILQAFYPGACGGRAIAEALFGRFSPSGKLPVTFYGSTRALPDFHDYSMENRTYRYYKGDVLYPFGFGLGYSEFEMDGLEASREACRVKVRNTGRMAARESVQVYVASPGQKERWSLCGIGNVALDAGEECSVEIALPASAFCRYDAQGDLKEIYGEHTLYVGFVQPDARSVRLHGQKPLTAVLRIQPPTKAAERSFQ
jgi:beta-glucosidase